MRIEASALRWSGAIAGFGEGVRYDGYLADTYAVRVVACRRLAGMEVMPHPSSRRRRLYLALAGVDGQMQIVGVFKTLRAAKRDCASAALRLGSRGTT